MSQAAACRHLATVRVTTEKLAKRVSCGWLSCRHNIHRTTKD